MFDLKQVNKDLQAHLRRKQIKAILSGKLMQEAILIIGASSQIAQASAHLLAKDLPEHQQIWISRKLQNRTATINPVYIQSDYSECSIEQICKDLSGYRLSHILIFNGLLHHENKQIFPEKKLEDLSLTALNQVFTANAFNTAIWLKYLAPQVKHQQTCYITVLSARVGSISDNQLGGWYAYRASKAALNMILKTAAVEFSRRAKNVKVIAFHPGTTDTELSKPFQKNVKPEKLFTPEFVAERLLSVVKNAPLDNQLSYLDWQGKSIAF